MTPILTSQTIRQKPNHHETNGFFYGENRPFPPRVQTRWRGRALEEAGRASSQTPGAVRPMHKEFQSPGLFSLAFYTSSKFPKLINKYFSAYLYFSPTHEAHRGPRI